MKEGNSNCLRMTALRLLPTKAVTYNVARTVTRSSGAIPTKAAICFLLRFPSSGNAG
jgi:hypothetical protein